MRIDLKIEKGEHKKYEDESYQDLNVTASHQLYDAWEDEEVQDSDYKVNATGLTELYTKLYDILQSQDVVTEPEFYIDDVLFAKTIGGFHLEPNQDFPLELVKKYGKERNLEFEFTDEIYVPYGENKKVDGIAVKLLGGIKAYNSSSASNYIKNENHTKEFKTEEAAKKAVNYYLTEDKEAYVPFLDKVSAKLNGEDLGLFVSGQKVEVEQPKQEESLKSDVRRNRRKI